MIVVVVIVVVIACKLAGVGGKATSSIPIPTLQVTLPRCCTGILSEMAAPVALSASHMQQLPQLYDLLWQQCR